MSWIEKIILWVGGVFVVFLAAWLRSFLHVLFPSPERAILALKNQTFSNAPSLHNVRVVLGWLDNDYKGNNTTAVSATFASIEGIELCRSARVVSASGAADEWRATMRRKAKDLLRAWHADLAVVGRVDRDGEALSLWFVSSREDDTFANTSGYIYTLRYNHLPDEFVAELHHQICALTLTLVIPKARNDQARRLGLRELAEEVTKLENLFRTLPKPEDRASLYMVYVLAQSSLGEWLGETERLRLAIDRAKEIIEDADLAETADTLFVTRVNLARTMYILGEREGDPKLLEEAVTLFDDTLNEVRHPERASLTAGIKGMAANALRALANRQRNEEHLFRAAEFLESALEVHQQEEDMSLVAITQNNLGLVYLDLAKAARSKDVVEQALSLFDSASTLANEAAMPTLSAMSQNNAGQAHEQLAEMGS